MNKTLLIFCCLFAMAQSAFALNVQSRKPLLPYGEADTLVSTAIRDPDTLTLGLATGFDLHPFSFTNSAGLLSSRSIVKYAFTFDLGASYAFNERLALSLGLPFHVSNNIESLANLAMETPLSMGDIMLSVAVNAIPADSNPRGFGLSVVPFLSLPTGSSSNFMGDASATGGFIVAGDVDLNGHYIGMNLGMRFRKEENFQDLRVAQEFLYSLAYRHAIIADQEFNGFVEFDGSTVMNDFFQKANATPMEVKVGLSKKVFSDDNPLTIKLVNGFGVGKGYGSPDYRFVVSLSYDHLLPRTRVIEKTVTVERVQKVEQRLKDLTIYYPTGVSQVDPFYDEKIAGIATVMRENPDMGPLYIVGHTDDVGKDAYNRNLSEQRAQQAFDSIVGHGLDPKQIIKFGMGESYPVAPNTSDDNRALNRRTVFTFQKPEYLNEAGGMATPPSVPVVSPAIEREIPAAPLPPQEDVGQPDKAYPGFVDDDSEATGIITEETHVHEKTEIKKGRAARQAVKEDRAASRQKRIKKRDRHDSSPQSIKGKSFRPKKNEVIEKDLSEKDSFDEPFVE